ncbi:hypothetical protein EUTSA_v10005543mg [Eutrema salsugineum]|uniref:Uncharacterized protein n=1 Tax=Eutrema salsugineum TaxID=72664 RepID=V4KZB2_EUTSA|nr:hypothetical protein EUTSA_v10005543mg [Eutrema salsugineum]
MKTFSIFLFGLSICMISHVYGAGFKISNELQFKKKLWFSCYSGNNRIKPQILEPGGSWEPKPNYRHHQSFTAFKQEGPADTGSGWDWRARENGIYLKVWGGKDSKSEVNMHKKYDWIY